MGEEMKHKKLIITLASVGGAIIILASVLLGLFCPRKIGFYFNVKADKVDSVYAVSYDIKEGQQECYLDKDKIGEFLKAIKKVTVSPYYGPKLKCMPMYHFYITIGDMRYSIDSMGISYYQWKDGNNVWDKGETKKSREYKTDESNMKELLKYFDM